MDSLLEEYENLSRDSNLSKSLDDVQKTIDLLERARESIATSKITTSPSINPQADLVIRRRSE